MELLRPRLRARAETRVLGSRFLAEAGPVEDEAGARERRLALAQECAGATHLVWALRLRLGGGVERELSDDAGEPAGTAGLPILQAMRSAGVSQSLVVVARWFGGVKLGRGGLARAYRDAARAALLAAGVERVEARATVRIAGPVAADGEVRHLVARHGGRVVGAGYDAGGEALLTIELPEAHAGAFAAGLAETTRGAWRGVDAGPSDRRGDGDRR